MALTTAFARNGNKKAVPQSTADGSVSYDQGFGNLYALPPEEGGLFIDRAQFNQIMYDTTSAVISNQNSITTLNGKVTANQNSINTLNSSVNTLNTKVANIESGVTTGVVNLTTNQTIGGIKTFSVPPVSATNPANNNQVANKAYVDSVASAKANKNATVNLTGNQEIAGVKTFSSIPVSATQPTNANQVANKAYVDSVGNTAVKLTGAQEIAGAKTFTNNITAPNITAMQNNLNTIFSSTTSPVRYQNSAKEITVGTGGNFQTIQQAIQEARKYSSNVAIKLVSNISISESISLLRINGKHIAIRFEGFKIINSTSSNLSFAFNNSSLADIVDLNLENVSLSLAINSSVYLGGNVNINCENIDADCIRADYLSNICIGGKMTCNVKHAAGYVSLNSLRGSSINIGDESTINDNSSSGSVLSVYRGIIYTADVTINSTIPKANQVANTLTNNGIIFGNYSL